MTRINLLDPNLGIQSVMQGPAHPASLPLARQLAANVLSEAGLEELYAPSNVTRCMEAALCPDVGDGTLVQPGVFFTNLTSCAAMLQTATGPAARELLDKEITPLLENKKLLTAYVGLMIGG